MSFPSRRSSRCLFRTLARLLVGALVAALLLPGAPAAADPISEKKAEAERIATRLEEQTARVSSLTEELNEARVESARLAEALAGAEQGVTTAKDQVAATRARLTGQAVDAYVQGGGLRSVEILMGSGRRLAELPVRATYVRTATGRALETLDVLRAERARLEEEEARLAGAKAAAEDALAAVEARHSEAAEAVARQEATLAEVEGELAGLVAEEERRRAEEEARRVQAEVEARQREAAAREAAAREAAEREAARREAAEREARTSPKPAPTPPTDDAGNADTGSAAPGAAAAVEEARRQLGKPYEYGADGPDSFDCSGLTQWAWNAGGKYLPHSSRAQYAATSRVELSNIQLGDLLFFGPSVSGIHHVAIYAGDGRMIEASQTGTPVRYASIYRSDMVGIGRVN